jgi:dipeptidase D
MPGLKPFPVWKYFEEICRIPRLSGNESSISKYLLDFAGRNNLESKQDKAGNVLIIKPSSRGMENRKTVVLQAHVDIVGEKIDGNPHDWLNDPVIPLIKEGWVTADGTTLGADDGIGIATQLAIMEDKELVAGKTEALFTVDEESGMTGALNLDPGFFEGRTLINLDSEDEGIIYIGCAGGMETSGTLIFDRKVPDQGSVALTLSLTGLHGGHSGDEIHKGYGNSIKIMNRLLTGLSAICSIKIRSFEGGNLKNAIPREAFSTIVIEETSVKKVTAFVESFFTLLKDEFGEKETDMQLSIRRTLLPPFVIDSNTSGKLMNFIECCPHGATAWSREMNDLVETSTNLASLKFSGNNSIHIVTTQRSSRNSSKHDLAGEVEKCLRGIGADVVQSNGYPGWEPNMSSEILRITRESYRRLHGKDPLIKSIHAGLECGIIFEKIKNIDMISIGPTIRGAHTPDERIEIESVMRFWNLLIDVIKNMPAR